MKVGNPTKNLIRRLAEQAQFMQLLDLNRVFPKPGQCILELPEHERALLVQLKSDDIADVRWPLTA